MDVFLKIIVIIIAIALIVGPFIFIHVRKIFREQKNYERGLKIVPLLIHLPPPSDDTENRGGRDVRDVNEEAISKAQIIYNIIAGTWEKGFNKNFYGQRHVSFEIIGTQGFIYYYAAIPISLVDVVKQAITSAYPTSRIEETNEHNIFSSVGKINGTLGGEFVLKQSYAFPIATYQDIKRDAMQSILSSFSGLNKDDGAAIQILFRPAHPSWRKNASDIASKKRKGQDSKKGAEAFLWWIRSLAIAIFKPPENKKEADNSSKKELSNLENSTLDSIDDKTRYSAFETVIRVLVSSNVSQRTQSILSQVIASFSLFDAPGKNGFKYIPAKDIESLVTAYIMRFFPQHHKGNILNSVELASIFHFPDQSNIPTSQVVKQASKQVDGPRNIPEDGLLLGYNVFRGAKKPIRLAIGDRQRHVYAVGQTGTGKSIFLENLALQDMLNGNGFAFIDPHGDTVEDLLAMVPKERTEDLIYFSPGEMEYPMGLNLFEFSRPDQKDFLIQEALNMLYKLYDPNHQGIMGPRYEHLFRMAALTIMADPAGGTFVDLPKLFRDPSFVEKKLKYVTDQNVLDFWRKEMPQSQRSNDFGEVVSWFVSKFSAFSSNEMMRNIIGQTKSSFDLRSIMDNKKILLVNLSKGGTGELNSKLLGMIFVMKFQAAAMSRVDVPESERNDFALYVDEFQNFSTDSLATIMSEARKFRLNLIVANQFTTQLSQEIRDAVFGNIGTIISFRIGQNDVEGIGKYFSPIFEAEDLLRVPNFNTVVRTLIGGVPTQPFTMATLPQLGTPNRRLAEALKQLSSAKYGKPRAIVEKEIIERLASPEPTLSSRLGSSGPQKNIGAPREPFTNPFNTSGGTIPNQSLSSTPGAPVTKPATSRNPLDDWLAGFKKNKAATVANESKSPNNLVGNGNLNSQQVASSSPQMVGNPGLEQKNNNSPDDNISKNNLLNPNISSPTTDKVEVNEIAKELEDQIKSAKQRSIVEDLPKAIVAKDNMTGDINEGHTIHIART